MTGMTSSGARPMRPAAKAGFVVQPIAPWRSASSVSAADGLLTQKRVPVAARTCSK